MKWRAVGVGALLTVGALLLAASIIAAFARDTLSDSNEFAARARVAFSTPEVRESLTGAVVDQLVEAEPELLAVRPLLETVVDGALRSDAASQIFEAAVADLHRSVFTDADDTVLLQLTDLLLVAKTQLTVLDPELGALIPDELTDAVVEIHADPVVVDLSQTAEHLDQLAFWLPLLTMAAFAAALWLSDDPGGTSVYVGLVTIGGAAVVLVALEVLGALAKGAVEGDADAKVVTVVWDAFTADLSVWALIVAAAGGLVATVAWLGWGSVDLDDRVDRLRTFVHRRRGRWARIAWGTAVVLAGVVLIVRWETTVRFAVSVVGAVLVAIGAREVVDAFVRGADARADRSPIVEPSPEGDRRLSARWMGTGAIVLLGTLGLAAVWGAGDSGDGDGAEDTATECNGSAALCDRPFDEVVFAGTHNSNAAANDGYALGYQSDGIIPQLEDGVRALLIDVYFGLDSGGSLIVTDRAPVTDAEREQMVAEMGEAAVSSAEAAVARTEELGGERGLFLCHAFCEIGATPFVGELERIREFLEDNPGEVIMMIIQDEGPLPADVATAFDESGLIDLVFAHEPDEPWPTLGELIEADQRVFVSAENRSGELDWYQDAFTFVQDTPFGYEAVADFDCVPNRGTDESPLLLANHWLNPASPTSADEANASTVLLDRVDQCIAERGRLPSVIAVDFHDRGDLVEVVRGLNGV